MTTIGTKVATISTALSTAWNGIKATASNTWNAIKREIMKPILAVKTWLDEKIAAIKSLFSFEWSLPPIKLPHFKIVDGITVLGITLPTIGVDWYAKGGVFTKPTLLGGNNGVGEAGPEAVLPLETLWDEMQNRLHATLQDTYAEDNDARDIDYTALASALIDALSGVTVNMDGTAVGNLVTNTVSRNIAKTTTMRRFA